MVVDEDSACLGQFLWCGLSTHRGLRASEVFLSFEIAVRFLSPLLQRHGSFEGLR